MNKFIPYSPSNPPLAVISNDKDMFCHMIINHIKEFTEKDFYNWLGNDINFCYLVMWLHPQTSYTLFDSRAKIIAMRKRSDYEHAIRMLKSTWNYKDLINTIISKYGDFIRMNSDYIFNQYRNKYERIELSKRYLEYKLPFYYNRKLVDTYSLKYNRQKEVTSVVFIPPKLAWGRPSITEQTMKIETIFSNHGFIPYALCHLFDVLRFLPDELCKMCVKYFLHPEASYDLSRNEECRVFEFDYPETKKRKNPAQYVSDDDDSDVDNLV